MSRLRYLTIGVSASLLVYGAALAQTDGNQTDGTQAGTTTAGTQSAGSQASVTATSPVSDDEYVRMAAAGDAFEIASSQLALDQSSDDAIQEFAQRMIDDHTAMSTSLLAASARAGIEVPALPTDDPRISTLTNAGDDFDRQYVAMQLEAHQEALALHQGYAASGTNEALRQVAETATPIVASHLEHLQNWASSANH